MNWFFYRHHTDSATRQMHIVGAASLLLCAPSGAIYQHHRRAKPLPFLPFAAIQTAPASVGILEPDFIGRLVMKWAGMYLVGFVVVVGGLLAALWKLGILESIGTTWTLIGIAIVMGIGIMISVSNSGSKENIEIDRK
jgi:hypothetical protein